MHVFGGSSGLVGEVAAHRFPGDFEPVGVVDETIKDSIGVGGIAGQIKPARDWKLARDQG